MRSIILIFVLGSTYPSFASPAIDCPGIPLAECARLDIVEGRLNVPLDWHDRSDKRQIEVKYRILNSSRSDLPWLFFIGGGPGMESLTGYTAILKAGFAANFRVVLFDQRGNGESTPLLKNDPALTPTFVARYFSTRQIKFDLVSLIRRISQGEPFFLMGHSFGGVPLTEYILQPDLGVRPDGIIYLASPLFLNSSDSTAKRYQGQIVLNSLISEETKEKIRRIRLRIRTLKSSGYEIYEFYLDARVSLLPDLSALEDELDRLLSPWSLRSPENFISILKDNWMVAWYDRFAPVISAVDMPVDDGQVLASMGPIPDDDGVIGEFRLLEEFDQLLQASGEEYPALFMAAVDTYQTFQAGKPERLRAALSQIPTLFVLGTLDPFVNFELNRSEALSVMTQGFHRLHRVENGNHDSVYQPDVSALVSRQIQELSRTAKLTCTDVLNSKPAQ